MHLKFYFVKSKIINKETEKQLKREKKSRIQWHWINLFTCSKRSKLTIIFHVFLSFHLVIKSDVLPVKLCNFVKFLCNLMKLFLEKGCRACCNYKE